MINASSPSLLAGGPRCAASALAGRGSKNPQASGLLGEVRAPMALARDVDVSVLSPCPRTPSGGVSDKGAPPSTLGTGQESGPFWLLVDRSAGPEACWPWTGYADKDGYGTHTKGRRAHRVACEAGHGPPPFPGARALHGCDNPPCCNPAHLSWGTQKQNVADCIARGRHRNFGKYGRYVCGACGQQGHNARTCGTGREGLDQRRRRHPLTVERAAAIAASLYTPSPTPEASR